MKNLTTGYNQCYYNVNTISNTSTFFSDFHYIRGLFQGLAAAVKVHLVWPPVVRSGLLALRLLQAPACSLIRGRARFSQWLWTVTLRQPPAPNLRSGQNLCSGAPGNSFRSMLWEQSKAGHGRGGALGERAWQGGVAKQMLSDEFDKGCWEYSEAEDVCNTHRSSHALRPRNPY